MAEPNPNTSPDQTAAASSIPPQPSMTATSAETSGGNASSAGGAIPTHIGQYVLLSELGRGGMGVVYRAEDPHLKREIAIKLMLPQFASNPVAKARFVREARAQAKVEHDHVAAIFQVAEHAGLPYLVMPLLKGMTLHAALRANPRPPLPEVIRIGRETAEGLAAAHEKGLVHRDIKPANIWLEGKKLRVKVLDFGLARVADSGATEADDGPVTQEGAIVGTPTYMSPEQARGDTIDGRTDLWSVGVMLYQMATGELPFDGRNTMAILARLSMDEPPPPITKNPAVPPALSDLIMRLLAKNPAYRTPTADQLAEELRALESGMVNAVRVIPLDAPPPLIVGTEGPDPFADLNATETSGVVEEQAEQEEAPPKRAVGVNPRGPKRGGIPAWTIACGVLLAMALIVGLVVSQMGKKPEEVVKEDPPPPQKAEPPKPGELLTLKFGNPQVEMRFRWVPAGSFQMGSDNGEANEKPVHKVTISKGFWMAETECTQAQWKAVMGTDPSQVKGDTLPVAGVSWGAAQAFCDRMSQSTGKAIRLPTEAQWEYACRAGTTTDYHTGNGEDALKRAGWYDGNSGSNPQPVGQKEPNAWGLRDLHGGVWEFCLDDLRTYTTNSQTDPVGSLSGDKRVIRGSAYVSGFPGAGPCRSAFRSNYGVAGDSNVGFRVICEAGVPPPKTADPERVAAELILPYGQVALHLDNPPRDISIAPDRPEPLPNEPFTIRGVLFAAQFPNAPADFGAKLVPALARLSELGQFEDFKPVVRWSGEQLAQLGANPALREKLVKFHGDIDVSPKSWEALKQFRFSGLEFSGERITDDMVAGLPQLGEIGRLEITNLGKSERLTAKGWASLLNARKVEALLLVEPRGLAPDVCKAIASTSGLQSLFLSVVAGSGELNEACYQELAKIPTLTQFSLNGHGVPGGTTVPDAGWKHIAGIKTLRNADFHTVKFSQAALDALATMTHLRNLQFFGTGATEDQVKKLNAALPRCIITWDKGTLEPSDPHFREGRRCVAGYGNVSVKLASGKTVEVAYGRELPDDPFTITSLAVSVVLGDEHLIGFTAITTLVKVDIRASALTAKGLRALTSSRETLTELTLIGGPNLISSEMLEVIGEFSNLRTLHLGNTAAIPDWKPLAKLTKLEKLQLQGGATFTDEALKHLAALPKLVELQLQDTPISDAGVETLAGMKQLTTVDLSTTRVTKAGYEKLRAALPKCNIAWADPTRAIVTRLMARGCGFVLRLPDNTESRVSKPEELPPGPFTVVEINAYHVQMTDTDLLWLEPLASLRNVELAGSGITATGFRSLLASKDTLKRFLFQGTCDDDALEVVAQLPRLEHFWLTRVKITETHAKHIASFPQLRILEISHCDASDEVIAPLSRSKSITVLSLAGTPISDASIDHLVQMEQLTALNAKETRITKVGYEKLKAALPKCNVGWEDPTRAVMARLLARGTMFDVLLPDNKRVEVRKPEEIPAGSFTVKRFYSVNGNGFTDSDILWLSVFPNLPEVDLSRGHTVTAAGLRSLLIHKNSLTGFHYFGTPSEEAWKVIAEFTKLDGFAMDWGSLSEVGAKTLAELPQLRVIEFPRCDTPASSLAQLAKSKSVIQLSLTVTSTSDEGLEHLATMKQQIRVGAIQTRVTQEGINRFKAAKPDGIGEFKESLGWLYPSDGWLNLMPIIDPKKDHAGGVGTWVRTERGLEGSHPDAGNMVRLRLPLTFHNEYDSAYELEVEFTRPKDSQNAVIFELGVGPVNLVGAIFGLEGKAGLGLIDGKEWTENGTAKPHQILPDQRVKALLRVRGTYLSASSVEADIDGKPLLSWKGKAASLGVNTGNQGGRTIDLCIGPPGKVIIHSVRFRTLEGSALLTRPEDLPKLLAPKKP